MLIVANSTRSYLSALHVWVALDSKSFSLTRNRFIKDMKTPTLRIVFKKMNLGIVMAEDGSPLDICDCKESAGLKYSLPPLAAWPTPLCSNWSDLLIRKPKAPLPPSWSNPLDMVIKYFSPSEEGKGGEKKERGSHRRTFFKQHHVFFYFCIYNFYLFIFCICLFASCSLIHPLLFRVIRWVDKRPVMQFLQQNLTGLHNPPLFIGSSFNGCNVTLGLSAAFIATFSPVIKTECLNCTAWD